MIKDHITFSLMVSNSLMISEISSMMMMMTKIFSILIKILHLHRIKTIIHLVISDTGDIIMEIMDIIIISDIIIIMDIIIMVTIIIIIIIIIITILSHRKKKNQNMYMTQLNTKQPRKTGKNLVKE